jgi:hypothetical protein
LICLCHRVVWPGVRSAGLPRLSGGADAGRRRRLDPKYGPIRQCNDLIDLIDCDVGPWQVAAPLRRLLPTTFGYGHGLMPGVRVERFVGRGAE